MRTNKEKLILLVEDDDNDAELTINALTTHKVANNIKRLQNGEEALDYLFQKGKYVEQPVDIPALILLDLKMPKVNGLEVLKKIRNEKKLRHIPVVILTSSKEENDLVESYELGVNAYVVKPVDFNEFISAIKDLGIFWLMVNTPPPYK